MPTGMIPEKEREPLPAGMRVSSDTRSAGIDAELKVRGQAVTLADPSGGTFNAAADFDRLLPVTQDAFPALGRIDPTETS